MDPVELELLIQALKELTIIRFMVTNDFPDLKDDKVSDGLNRSIKNVFKNLGVEYRFRKEIY